jgi:hypothetical protein
VRGPAVGSDEVGGVLEVRNARVAAGNVEIQPPLLDHHGDQHAREGVLLQPYLDAHRRVVGPVVPSVPSGPRRVSFLVSSHDLDCTAFPEHEAEREGRGRNVRCIQENYQ